MDSTYRRDLLIGLAICKSIVSQVPYEAKAHITKGGIGYCTFRIVHKQLLAVQKVTRITKVREKPPKQVNEDGKSRSANSASTYSSMAAIKLDTLAKLLPNASEDIARA